MATTVNDPIAASAAASRRAPAKLVESGSRYFSILIQAVIVVYLAERFKLENDLFLLALKVSVAGFAIHSLLPRRFRLAFFSLLSIGTILYCLGLENGRWSPMLTASRGLYLFGFSAALIGICHLPIRFMFRVGLLGATAAGLALVRGGSIPLPQFEPVWPVFAAMFMFRIMIYLYDVETDKKKKPHLTQTLSYFFTFPNLWLYVAPILDFKAFHRSYYNTEAFEIYQRGVVWIMRGIFHLLLWKIVYYQVYVDPARVTNGTELAQYLLGNMALYLRLSGQFHIMTGILHLFGFHVAETHRLYFLATSFNDYWRRINIYWKDFMLKLFFYPPYARLKRFGLKTRVILATVCVFFTTWLFHPIQFFWIRGSFPLRSVDALFWGLLCALVCIGSIRDLSKTSSSGKTLGKTAVSWSDAASRAAYASLTFTGLTLLWSIWSCDNVEQWIDLWRTASVDTAAFLLLAMAAIFAGSLWFEGPLAGKLHSLWQDHVSHGWAMPWRRAIACCCLPAAFMVASTSSHVTSRILSLEGQAIAASVFQTRPNKSDEEFMVRGYYEDLADTSRFRTLLNDGFRNQPADWVKLEDTAAVRPVNDLRVDELVPSLETVVNGKRIAANRFGMRDSDVDPDNRQDAVRIAVLGASHEMGYGVDQGETFSDVLEVKLNAARKPESRPVEILNFAMNHYSPVAQVEVVKRKVLAFRPDAVLLFAHREDVGVVMRLFGEALRQGVPLEYPALAEIAARAGIGQKTARSIAERKLIPHWPEMIEWAYGEIARDLRSQNVIPVWVLQQGVYPFQGADEAVRMAAWAKAAGYELWTMEDVFRGADPASLIVAPWDTHPNAEGHRMIAETLYSRFQSTNLIERAAPRQARGAADRHRPAESIPAAQPPTGGLAR